MSVHAKLSASAAHRWIPCPGSVRLSAGIKSESTYNAAEGTVAHEVAAAALNGTQKPQAWLGKKRIVEDKFEVEVTQEMIDAVNLYVEDIDAEQMPLDQWFVEVDLTPALKRLHESLGGTADYVRYRPRTKHLKVRDLKYGKGVLVDVEENEQAMIYALGALLTLKVPCEEVTVVIDQPRAEHPDGRSRPYTFPSYRLLEFADELVTAAKATEDPNAPLVPGEKQCRWCPAKPTCPALRDRQTALMADQFVGANYPTLPIAKLEDALDLIPAVKARVKALEELAYTRATQGEQFTRYKLVDKRPTRKWKDEEALRAWAESQAVDIFEQSVLSPAQLEKRLAANAPRGEKKNAGAVIAPFVESVSSGQVLVPLDDDRPQAKRITASDFYVLPTGD